MQDEEYKIINSILRKKLKEQSQYILELESRLGKPGMQEENIKNKITEIKTKFKEKNMSQELPQKSMVRYGRNRKNNRNSVLYTFRDGDSVFFGVARCNEGDKFDKERGLAIAKGRADKFFSKFTETPEFFNKDDTPTAALDAHSLRRDSLCGCVFVSDVPLLLEWFRGLNQ